MKRVKYTLVLLLAILTVRIHGDVIIVDYSPTKICVRITNLNDYPDIEIIGLNNCFAVFSKPKVNIVDSISSLEVHKACPLTFYAVKKEYLKEKGIENINWKKDKNVRKSDITVNARKTRVGYPNVENLEMNFIIVGFNEKSMVMYPISQTHKFNNGDPDEVYEFGLWSSLDSFRALLKLRKTF